MGVVVNATPLIALSLINRLTLLKQLFNEVIVPSAVYEEVALQGIGRPGARFFRDSSWIEVLTPKVSSTIEPLLLGLIGANLSRLCCVWTEVPLSKGGFRGISNGLHKSPQPPSQKGGVLLAKLTPMCWGLNGRLQVLLLAMEVQPDWVLIDRRLARRVARVMGLTVKGTVGVLLAAFRAGFLSNVEALEAVHQLIEEGIRISPTVVTWFQSELDRL